MKKAITNPANNIQIEKVFNSLIQVLKSSVHSTFIGIYVAGNL